MNAFQHLLWRNSRLLVRNFRGNLFHPAWGANYRQKSLITLYHGVNEWLQSLPVDYWITFGTLLGYFRENNILPHDKDIDFALPVDAAEILWEHRSRLPSNFRLIDTSYSHHGPKFYVDFRAWEADLYFYEVKENQWRPQIRSRLPEDREVLDNALIYPLTRVAFLETETFIPRQTEAYLTQLYHYIGPEAQRDPKTGYYRPRS